MIGMGDDLATLRAELKADPDGECVGTNADLLAILDVIDQFLDLIGQLRDPRPCAVGLGGRCETHAWLKGGVCPHFAAGMVLTAMRP